MRQKLPENLLPNDWQHKKGYKNMIAGKIADGTQATAGACEQYRTLCGLAVASSAFYAHVFWFLHGI